MVNNNTSDVMKTHVSESTSSFPENISEFNVYPETSKNDEEIYLSAAVLDVFDIPIVVSERLNNQEAVSRKRPSSDDYETVINNKIMKPPESKCICINNDNNTQVFPTVEENYASYSGNITQHTFNINDIFGNTEFYEKSYSTFHPFGVQSHQGYLQNTPTAEKDESHYICSSVIEIIHDDTQTENSEQDEYAFIQNSTDQSHMTRKQLRRKHHERRRKIAKSITCNLQPVIVVWCPLEQLRPDFIVTTLGKYDDDLEVRDRWSFPSITSTMGAWGGAIAEFLDEETALAAAKDLSQQSKHVKILKLSWLFNEFVNAEIRHPLYNEGTTRIIASGRRCAADSEMIKESTLCMENMFRQCGDVCHIEFYLDQDESENICEVSYTFASHAYLAKFFLTGMMFKPVLSLSIEVEETEKEKEILNVVKRNMREFLEETKSL